MQVKYSTQSGITRCSTLPYRYDIQLICMPYSMAAAAQHGAVADAAVCDPPHDHVMRYTIGTLPMGPHIFCP